MCSLYKYALLLGNYNARTQEKQGFIDIDEFFAEHVGYDDTMYQFYNISSMLSQFNLAENRVSKDKSSNNEGNLLIEICKSNNLFILNDRCGNDKGKGVFTFKNTSVIDYIVVSAQALKFIENFDITELDCLYSDGHCLLSTDLTFKQCIKIK